jgi:NO-binding membrane sensor protein with MHYT domain
MKFYIGSGYSESKNLTSSLALLICGFLLLILIPSMEFGLMLLYSEEPHYRYDKFLTLLQITQTHTRSRLLL